MLSELDIGGVYVAPIAAYGVAAAPIAFGLRTLLWRTGLLALLPVPSLATLALYVAALSLLVRFA